MMSICFRNTHTRLSASLALAGIGMLLLALSGTARAVDYTIDSANSSLTVVAIVGVPGVGPVPLDGQSADPNGDPASTTSALQGTLSAQLVGSTLTFSGGSMIDVLPNANAPFFPSVGSPIVGSDPPAVFSDAEDNFGYQANLGFAGFAYAALRDIAFDLGSGSASFGGSVSALTLDVTNGIFAFALPPVLGGEGSEDPVTTTGILNQSAGLLQQSLVGTLETITIPVESLVIDGDNQIAIMGQIVASRVVPEPSTAAGLGWALLSSLWLWRRRAR